MGARAWTGQRESVPNPAAIKRVERKPLMNRGPMPAYLAPISLRLPTLRTWRDLQRLLAAYPDPHKGWRGHLQVQEIVLDPKTPRKGIALRVTQYDDVPDDDLPLKIEVQLASGGRCELAVQHLQVLGVVW
jgi:hypothetical protein